MAAHLQNQHGVSKGGTGQEDDGYGGSDELRTYRMAFPENAGRRPCSVEGCSGQAATRMVTWVHFWHGNVRDNMVILEEGNLPHPQCLLCDMLEQWWSLNGPHKRTA